MKKIIIIGASSGIGRELARIYAAKGNRVGITGRRLDLLLEFQTEFPDQLVVESFDVMGDQNIAHLENLIQKLGGLDLLIYNSGYGEISDSLDWEIEKKTVDTNVNGFIEITAYGFNYFLKQGNGHLVAISSIGSIRGNSMAPAYSASKSFQSNYLEGLHMRLKKLKSKVRVTDVQPGFVDTKMGKGNKMFWVAPVHKAAEQITDAISAGKWRAYITRRWWLIAKIMDWIPNFIYHKMA
ncbi:MAG: SDR family NAD(P)-dependent oxidoreductase [Chitinophagales bacterium]